MLFKKAKQIRIVLEVLETKNIPAKIPENKQTVMAIAKIAFDHSLPEPPGDGRDIRQFFQTKKREKTIVSGNFNPKIFDDSTLQYFLLKALQNQNNALFYKVVDLVKKSPNEHFLLLIRPRILVG